MPDAAANVTRLVQSALDADLTPEQVCGGDPGLLSDVRLRWERCRRIVADLDSLFPSSDPTGGSQASGRRRRTDAVPAVPGYDMGSVLGRGGVGVVYRAKQLRLGRDVALKTLLAGPNASRLERARFLREARAAAGLRHPNVVQVYDVGQTDGGVPFFTMELIDGGTLADQLTGAPRSVGAAAEVAAVLADAVATAHRAGIVHRDLKPANVLMTVEGTPKVGDFGLARSIGGADALTLTGARVGTVSYMAPEQAAGPAAAVGPPADVYALGAVLYHMLTGRPPFLAASAAETERQLLSDDPVPPTRVNRQVPPDLETICLKCLTKDPGRRYPTASALAEDLVRFRAGRPIQARPVGRLGTAAKWARRHPSALVAAASVTAAACVALAGVGGVLWLLSARAATAAAVEQDLREAVGAQRRSAWGEATAAVGRADARLNGGGPPDLRARLVAARRDSALAGQLESIRLHHAVRTDETLDGTRGDADYQAAFAAAGLARPAVDDPAVVAARARTSNIRDELLSALDDWFFYVQTPDRERWLLDVVRRADAGTDPTGWRDRMRAPATWADPAALATLARDLPVAAEPTAFLLALNGRLRGGGRDTVPFLTRVQGAHPDDFWANLVLGEALSDRGRQPESLRYLQAAVAISPDASVARKQLGLALTRAGRPAEAAAEFRQTIRLAPDHAGGHVCLGIALVQAKDLDGAVGEMAKGVELLPGDWGYRTDLGQALAMAGRLPEAAAELRRAVALSPTYAPAQVGLRAALCRQGRQADAAAAWRAAIAANPADHPTWDGYAEFCLSIGLTDDYRRARAELLDRFGDSRDPDVCERTGRACLLLPPSPDELRRATAAIDRAVAALRPNTPGPRPYFLFAKGLAEYRADHPAAAVALLDGPAAKVLGPAPELIAAMAEFRLGRVDAARRQFAAAVASFDWDPSKSDSREAWMYHLLRREAQDLIRPDAGPTTSP